MTAYAESKAALESLTRGLTCKYAPDDVRVNAKAPRVVPVERMAELFSDKDVVLYFAAEGRHHSTPSNVDSDDGKKYVSSSKILAHDASSFVNSINGSAIIDYLLLR
jgi:NAD(P)-dependent dehydrogenase (short-subunit alcohol dehydrogenase family)